MREDVMMAAAGQLKAEAADNEALMRGRLEPGVAVNENRPETQIFLASIAISLKRVADSLQVLETQIWVSSRKSI